MQANTGRILLVAVLLTALVVPIGLASQAATEWSSLVPPLHWLNGKYPNMKDSWMPMFEALAWHREHGPAGLYENVFFERGIKFQYAPTSLLPLTALEGLGVELSYPMLNNLNRIILPISVLGIALLTFRLLSMPHRAIGSTLRWTVTVYVAAGSLLFYPLMMPVEIGQVQVWINCAFIYACLAWLADRRVIAGVLIGLICLLKPQFALFGIWALVRREWHFAFAMALVGTIGLVVSIVIFGFEEHLEYLRVLSFISNRGEAYYPNHSVNGLLNRLMGHDPDWQTTSFAPYNPIVHFGTLGTSIVFIVLAMVSPRPVGGTQRLTSFMFAALAFTVASPVAWEHHYGILAPIFATILATALVNRWRPEDIKVLLLGFAYFFSTNYIGFTDSLTGTPFNILQSYLFFGALATMVILWSMLSAREAEVELS